jgi:hypothetical protein
MARREPINVVQSNVTQTLTLKFSHSDADRKLAHIFLKQTTDLPYHCSNGQSANLNKCILNMFTSKQAIFYILMQLSKLFDRLLSTDDHDKKALFSVISCYQILMFYYGARSFFFNVPLVVP